MIAMRKLARFSAPALCFCVLLVPASGAGPTLVAHTGEWKPNGLSPGAQRAESPLFEPVVTYDPGGSQATKVATADLNADGRQDVVVVNCGSCYVVRPGESIGVMLGNGDGTLQPAATYPSGGVTPLFVTIADVNHDDNPDLVVANRCGNRGCLKGALVSVLLGKGDGTFESALTYGSGGVFATTVDVADLNGDGDPDIVVANDCADSDCNASVGVLLGRGDGTFQPAVTYRTGGVDAFAVTLADVNGDGTPDIVVAGCAPGSCFGRLSVLLGNRDGTFRTPVWFAIGGGLPTGVVTADLNGDGRTDLAVEHTQCCSRPNGGTGVFLGNGDGTFKTGVTYKSGTGGVGTSVAVADVNDDGAPDLVTTEQCRAFSCFNQGAVDVLLGNGDGTFQIPLIFGSQGFLTNSVAVADLDGDGGPDLVIANQCTDSGACNQSSVGVLLHAADADETLPVISIAASPRRLWPPNGKWVRVTVSGTMSDSGSGVDAGTATYRVMDDYDIVEPRGRIPLDAAGHYSLTILLPARRLGSDLNGRHYTIRVIVNDKAGNRGTAAIAVIVPHDARRPSPTISSGV